MRQRIDDEQMETIHVYMLHEPVEPEANESEPRWPRIQWSHIAPMWNNVQHYIMASIACVMLVGFAVAPAGGPLFTIKQWATSRRIALSSTMEQTSPSGTPARSLAGRTHQPGCQDVNHAATAARQKVEANAIKGLLLQPCSETISQETASVSVTRSCQTYTYTLPKKLHILSIKRIRTVMVVSYQAFQ